MRKLGSKMPRLTFKPLYLFLELSYFKSFNLLFESDNLYLKSLRFSKIFNLRSLLKVLLDL